MKRLVALVPLMAVLSACGVFGGDEVAETTVPSTTVVPSTTLLPTSTTDARRVTETADEVFAALSAGDAAALASVVPLVTPGSPAAVLVAHQEAVASLVGELVLPEATTTTSMVPVDPSSSSSSTSTSQPVAVIPDVRFSDPIFDDDGLVRSFSVNGTPVGALVREAGPVAVADGVQGRVASAYRTVAGRVSVLIDVTAAGEDLTVFGFAAVHRARTIESGSSGLTEAIGAWGADSVPAGASTRLLVVFDDGELDGEILLTVLTDSGLDIGLALPLIAP